MGAARVSRPLSPRRFHPSFCIYVEPRAAPVRTHARTRPAPFVSTKTTTTKSAAQPWPVCLLFFSRRNADTGLEFVRVLSPHPRAPRNADPSRARGRAVLFRPPTRCASLFFGFYALPCPVPLFIDCKSLAPPFLFDSRARACARALPHTRFLPRVCFACARTTPFAAAASPFAQPHQFPFDHP
jgi:hypothetical protein